MALEKGSTNVAFAARLQLGDADGCADVLERSGRIPEAALFSRTYAPRRVPAVVSKWREELEATKRSKQSAIAASLADPSANPEAFEEGWSAALAKEEELLAASLSSRSDAAKPPVVVPPEGAPAPNGIAA